MKPTRTLKGAGIALAVPTSSRLACASTWYSLPISAMNRAANLPRRYSREPDACQGGTDQHIEVIGAKPRGNAHGSSCRTVLDASFRHAWYVTEAQAVMLDQSIRRRGLTAPAQVVRRGADDELDVVELAGNQA